MIKSRSSLSRNRCSLSIVLRARARTRRNIGLLPLVSKGHGRSHPIQPMASSPEPCKVGDFVHLREWERRSWRVRRGWQKEWAEGNMVECQAATEAKKRNKNERLKEASE